MLHKKCLYVVAVPIGNYSDFTLRAIEILKDVDLVIGEEYSTTEKILKRIGIVHKEIFVLNEHNEKDVCLDLIHEMTTKKLSVAIISEAGTPCIADPGARLVDQCHQNHIRIVPIPGVSSIMTTLMVSGLIKDSFKYIGFLPVKTELRKTELIKLNKENIPIIILETPYRMKQLLSDIHDKCGEKKRIIFAYKLTQPEEMILKDTIFEIIKKTVDIKKGEFIVVLLPN